MLYHKNVYFPECVKNLSPETGFYTLLYSGHAIEQSRVDKYGSFEVPSKLELGFDQLLEIEVFDGANGLKATKFLFRVPYDDKIDITLVTTPTNLPFELWCKSCWGNSVTDFHRTLDKSKYRQS